jgi:hypothetical protein
MDAVPHFKIASEPSPTASTGHHRPDLKQSLKRLEVKAVELHYVFSAERFDEDAEGDSAYTALQAA